MLRVDLVSENIAIIVSFKVEERNILDFIDEVNYCMRLPEL